MSIKQRLYPNEEHFVGLQMHVDHARFVYNLGLEQRRMWKRSKHDRPATLNASRVNAASQMRELAELRGELDWLRAGSSSVQQAALRDLERAFGNFFAGHARYPVFKRRSERNGAFVVRDLFLKRLNRRWAVVSVPKVGPIRFRISRPWAQIEAASSARVTHRNGRWHITFTTPPADKIVAGTGAVVGIDRGVANTAALSDGRLLSIPTLTDAERRRFFELEQRLARQTRAAKTAGRRFTECRNRETTLSALAVLRTRLENRQTDWSEQTTTYLARSYDVVVIEDLQVRNMVRAPAPKPDPTHETSFLLNGRRAKAALNRAIHASRWTQFADRLEDKTVVVKVSAAYTSQTCRACGHVAPDSRESQAEFRCVACGHEAHADSNAASNILARGETEALRLLQPTGSGGSPAPPAVAPQEPIVPRGNRAPGGDVA